MLRVGNPEVLHSRPVRSLQAQLAEARAAIDGAMRHRRDRHVQAAIPGTADISMRAREVEKPFLVRSIWHDGQFTYLKSDATELPALYELKDGKPSVVNFRSRTAPTSCRK